MYTKDRRIESRSACLTKPNLSKLSIIKFYVTRLQQILNASNMDLMTEINVCKTMQKMYVVF